MLDSAWRSWRVDSGVRVTVKMCVRTIRARFHVRSGALVQGIGIHLGERCRYLSANQSCMHIVTASQFKPQHNRGRSRVFSEWLIRGCA